MKKQRIKELLKKVVDGDLTDEEFDEWVAYEEERDKMRIGTFDDE